MTPIARASARPLVLSGLVAVASALILSACGSGGSAPSEPSTAAHATAPVEAPRSAPPCQAQVGDFLASMKALRRELEVGLSYEDYVAAVGRVRASYDRLPTDRLTIDCLVESGTAAEKAFNQYIAAANAWGDCLSEAGCGAASIERRLQGEWRTAAHFLAAASNGAAG